VRRFGRRGLRSGREAFLASHSWTILFITPMSSGSVPLSIMADSHI
jgi:hypothetical protein